MPSPPTGAAITTGCPNLELQQAGIAGEYLGVTADRITRIVAGRLRGQRDTASEIAVQREARGTAPEIEIDEPRVVELYFDELITRVAPPVADPSDEPAVELAASRTSSRAYQKVVRRVFTRRQQLSGDVEPEAWPTLVARARAALRDMAVHGTRAGITVAVSSGALIAAITQQVLGLPESSAYGLFEAMRNCSITHFLHEGGRISLSSFNETTYLVAFGASRGVTGLITYR